MKYKAIIFDVDGTLIENEELHRQAFNDSFIDAGLDWNWSEKTYRDLLAIGGGKERIDHFQRLVLKRSPALSKLQVRTLHKRKRKLYERSLRSNNLTLREGVQELISKARTKGLKLAIATASSSSSVNCLCHSIWGMPTEQVFDFITSGDTLLRNKPSPEVYLSTLRKLCLKPSDCIAIEDSRTGLLAACSAGITTIVTPSSYTKNDDFSEASFICKSVAQQYLPEQLRMQLFE
ncbi:MAG: HAD-IA family hydrolase [Pseudomonadota bacterium]|nr:HAD-IA family hydrolase [Pseudomonadota bacterium]